MVRFNDNWYQQMNRNAGQNYVHLDANGRVQGVSMSSQAYNQAVALEWFLLLILWPAFWIKHLSRRWPGDLGKLKASLVTLAVFPLAALIMGILGLSLRFTDFHGYWFLYLVTSAAAWVGTGITIGVSRVVRWVKYGSR